MHYICVILKISLIIWIFLSMNKYAKQNSKNSFCKNAVHQSVLKIIYRDWPVVYVVYIYTHYLYYFGPQLTGIVVHTFGINECTLQSSDHNQALIAWMAVIKSTGGRQSGRAKNRHAPVFSTLSMNRHREVWRSPSADWTEIGVVPAISPFSCNVRSF